MEHSSITVATPRASGIPRPSRLPLLRPSSSLDIRPTSPTCSPPAVIPSLVQQPIRPSIGRQSLHGTFRGRPSLIPPPTPRGIAPGPRKTSTTQGQQSKTVNATPRPQVKQNYRGSINSLQTHQTWTASFKAVQQSPDQENEAHPEEDVYREEDATEAIAPMASPAPSLTDRTLESLSHVPTPGSSRRRSSFFNPHTPMTPSHPSTVMGNCSVSKLNYGTVRRTALPRPSSPLKPPASIPQTPPTVRPAARRITSTATTRTAATPARIPPSTKQVAGLSASASRPASAAAVSRRSSYMPSAAVERLQRPSTSLSTSTRSTAVERPRSTLVSRQLAKDAVSKPPITRISGTRASKPVTGRVPSAATNAEVAVKPTTSAALRSQIAQARAAQRNADSKPVRTGVDADDYNFQADAEGTNESSEQVGTIMKRIDRSRKDGRLNISAMGLKQIPREVLRMYTPEAVEQASIPWFETLPVSRLVAADNDLEVIQEEAFPDEDVDPTAEEARGHVFGGVESLDFHGNVLSSIPKGLRRLDMLTSLNLSRNKLDNRALDVISQVRSLRILDLSKNKLCKELPESIGELVNLENLDVAHNKLVLLPASLRSLVQLRILSLSNNRLSDLGMDSLVQLPNLTELRAACNALTGSLFPSTVDSLPSLQVMDVSNNSIASLSFSETLVLPSLTHLDVSRNRLYALPDITQWTNLLNLLAEENSLTGLPDGFTSLRQLRKADFKGNCFRNLDFEVANMRALEVLGLEANPLRERKWATMGWDSLRAELLRRMEENALAEGRRATAGAAEGNAPGFANVSRPMTEDDEETF